MYPEIVNNVLTRARDFDQHLTRIRTLNDQLISRSEKLLVELGGLLEKVTEKNAPNKCSICYTRPKTHCFISCGHTFCEPCCQRCKNSVRGRCYTCRTQVTELLRVYL